jgi:hypothetical protein
MNFLLLDMVFIKYDFQLFSIDLDQVLGIWKPDIDKNF